MKKAVITVIGIDKKGIIARVSAKMLEHDANILDISQTVVSGLFNMVLIADISSENCVFDQLSSALREVGENMGLQIRVQRSEIFEAMHQV
ncbi:MAG: ACT domain-containing protein [Clostridia bacterium]|nr:ACT domain-containing protein [Clostridiales bacterium]MBQ3232204.1 ACT domain-containing protein [Clostridia bacterium]MBQ6717138.1 ACT domain-containing protein [Clostridia bacterium]